MKFPFLRPPRRKASQFTKDLTYTAHPLALGTTLGEYKIEKVLTQTQSGYTYVANQGSTILQEYFPRTIAIRDTDGKSVLLRDESANTGYEIGLSKFLLLARILSQIEHSGRVVHYQEQHDSAWYAIDFEPRATVGDLYRAGKKVPEASLRIILTEALTYLEAVHQHDIFHLELGPDQIILSPDQDLALCGFNVCGIVNPDLREKQAPYYFAPEHSHTAGRIGPWSDFYGLGTVLYQGLNARIPPTAARRQDNLREGRSDPLIAAKKLGQGYYSNDFLELIDWLMELSTGDRPNNVGVVLQQIMPDSELTRLNQHSAPLSRGPSYSFENLDPETDPEDPHLSRDSHETHDRHTSHANIHRSTTKSDGRLMMDALNQISEHHPNADRVADALERASEVLDPPQLSHRWTSFGAEASSDYRLAGNSPPAISNSNKSKQQKSKEWVELLRPRTFHSNSSQHSGSSQTAHQSYNSSKPAAIQKQKTSTLFQLNWSNKSVLWTLVIGTVTVAGMWMWMWLKFQSIPVVEPTRIEVLGLKTAPKTLSTKPSGTTIDTTPPDVMVSDILADQFDSTALDRLLSRAKQHKKNGLWFGEADNNAYAIYNAVLDLNPSNKEALDGIDELVSKSLSDIVANLEQNRINLAKSRIMTLRQRGLASDQLLSMEIQIQLLENDELVLSQTLKEEQRRKQVVIRRNKINELLNRASRAFENGFLVAPPGKNALTLYRAALDLDRNNQRARNGINSIYDRYVQQARTALSQNALAKAEENLERASLVRRLDSTVLRLKEQLAKRYELLEDHRKIKTDLTRERASTHTIVMEKAKLNINRGVAAYYRGNYFEAYGLLKPLADSGFTRAQIRVGAMLLEGRGVPPSRALATEWFLKALSAVQLAAARGEAWAQSDYGDYFADGIVVQQDFRQAVIWYHRSAKQGYSPAQANLGLMHMHGTGVLPDWNEAIQWFRTAAAKGNYAAQENLRLLEIPPKSRGS